MKNIFLAVLLAAITLLSSCKKSDEIIKNHYVLDEKNSSAAWKGYKNDGFHHGSFSVTSQNLQVKNGKITGGTFIIPISTIRNFDLPEGVKDQLINHLKSADFFDIIRYPEATFSIISVETYKSGNTNAVEGANYLVTGEFSMLDKKNIISFPAKIDVSQNKLKAEAKLKLDRTKWGMTYAADPSLGDHYIFPEVDIFLTLSGNKQ